MVQVVGDDPTDVPVPGETFTFAQLKQAQADGDFAAVADSGKRVVRVPLDELLAAAGQRSVKPAQLLERNTGDA